MPLLEYWCQSVEDLAQHLYGVYFITVEWGRRIEGGI